ncbi:MAG: hypothetical protein ACLUED_03145 [Lachnospira eligens]
MITVEKIEENLKNLIGKPFNENDVICAFEDFEENGESKVYFDYLSNGDVIASIDTKNSQYWFYITTSFCSENKDFNIIITNIEVEKRF